MRKILMCVTCKYSEMQQTNTVCFNCELARRLLAQIAYTALTDELSTKSKQRYITLMCFLMSLHVRFILFYFNGTM